MAAYKNKYYVFDPTMPKAFLFILISPTIHNKFKSGLRTIYWFQNTYQFDKKNRGKNARETFLSIKNVGGKEMLGLDENEKVRVLANVEDKCVLHISLPK